MPVRRVFKRQRKEAAARVLSHQPKSTDRVAQNEIAPELRSLFVKISRIWGIPVKDLMPFHSARGCEIDGLYFHRNGRIAIGNLTRPDNQIVDSFNHEILHHLQLLLMSLLFAEKAVTWKNKQFSEEIESKILDRYQMRTKYKEGHAFIL